MIIGWRLHCPFNNVGDEHRGGFLDVVAAGMEEGIESELWTTGEVEAFGTPGDFVKLRIENGEWRIMITFFHRVCRSRILRKTCAWSILIPHSCVPLVASGLGPSATFHIPRESGIEADARGGLFVEGSYEAVKAGFAHE